MEKILLIDDDKLIHKILQKKLGAVFEFVSAYNGLEGMAMAVEHAPAVILLDVEMPGLNGYETCEKLKKTRTIDQIPVIFLSARSSTHARMLGYEAGADDFITKPFEMHEIEAKINVCIQYARSLADLELQIKSVGKTATLAIADSSDFARLVHLTAEMFKITGSESLAEKIFTYCSSIGLNTTVLITFNGRDEFYSSVGTPAPIEKELLLATRDDKRFIDFGCRTIINFSDISLLIKNMPLGDKEKYGRFKDLLPHLIEIALSCIRKLELETSFIAQSSELGAALQTLNVKIGGQLDLYKERSEKIEICMRSLSNELSERIPAMGLDDDQESYVLDTVSTTSYNVSVQLASNSELRGSLAGLSESLEQIVSQNKSLVEKLHCVDPLNDTGSDDQHSDIELF